VLPLRLLLALAVGLPAAAPAQTRDDTPAPAPAASADTARAVPASAAFDVLSPLGFTGGTLTPNARTLPLGTMGVRYDREVPGAALTTGNNYVIGFGLLPYVEATGRIAANDLHCNLYLPRSNAVANSCLDRGELRDLSMSFKLAVPLDEQERFSVALGATDVGGAATNFRSYYGVLGWRQGPFEASAGVGRSDARGALLSGPFGRLAVQVLPSLQLSAEHIPEGSWVSARAFVPGNWLPERWHVFAEANRRIGESKATGSSWLALGLSIPLDFLGTTASAEAQRRAALRAPTPVFGGLPSLGRPDAASVPGAASPRSEASAPASSTARQSSAAPIAGATAAAGTVSPARAVVLPAIGSGVAGIATNPVSATGSTGSKIAASTVGAAGAPGPSAQDPAPLGRADAAALARLAQALATAGVEDVSIGEQDRADGATVVIVRADNASWRWSDFDALGVVLARVARALAPVDAAFVVTLGRRGVPTLQVEGTGRCLEAFLRAGSADCPRGDTPRLRSSGEAGFDAALRDVRWAHRGISPSWGRTRVTIGPGLRSGVATEYGVFDYSLAAEVSVEVPLWKGASIEARRSFPLSHSSDYDDGAVFGTDRHKTVTDRVLLHQAIALGHGVTTRAAIGRIFDDWRGGLGEIRWEPGDGRHRIGASAAQFRNGGSLRDGFVAEPRLVSYRYLVGSLDWALELTAGRFFLNDTGWTVTSRHWFGDVAVAASLRSSQHRGLPDPEHFAGLQIELPLTPRRELGTRWIQVQGADRWAYGVDTVVGNSHNRLTGGYGIVPPVPNGLDAIHNYDRAASVYARGHWARIRSAAAADTAP
jgi:hypothetical protein